MKAIKHCERKALAAPCEDRFVLAPAPAPASNHPKGVSLFDQPVSDVLRRAPPTHPNTEVVQGLSAHVLREHYREGMALGTTGAVFQAFPNRKDCILLCCVYIAWLLGWLVGWLSG